MTWEEVFISVATGLITGVISGAITGIMVTRYYRKKDRHRKDKEGFRKYLEQCNTHLSAIDTELRLIQDGKSDSTELKRILNQFPEEFIPLHRHDEISRKTREVLIDVYNLLQRVNQEIDSETLDCGRARNDLTRISFQLLNLWLKG